MNFPTEIRVGIITRGVPRIRETDQGIMVDNLLIGEGFHWEREISALLHGKAEMLQQPQGNISMVNRLPVEKYVESVIGSEMSGDAPVEFLKAHAVISRSWAMRKIIGGSRGTVCGSLRIEKQGETIAITEWEEADSHKGFDVCSDDHCQRYQGLTDSPNASEAVAETEGLILADGKGEIADTRFSKCCGGMTEWFSTCWDNSDKPYLVSKRDQWCDLSELAADEKEKTLRAILKDYDRETIDFKDWKTETDGTRISEALNRKYKIDIGNVLHLCPMMRGGSPRINRLRIVGSRGTVEIGKTLAIRRLLSAQCLKSSWFNITESGGKFIIGGHGWGHGVGLCQIGAARMALSGKNFIEILEFYYPGTKLMNLHE